MEAYIAEIRLFAGNFAPVGWAFCMGQLLPISQYAVVFALIGTFYGGDGIETFALPDLRGRVPVGMGQSPTLTSYALGEATGSETIGVTTAQVASGSGAVVSTPVSGGSNVQPVLALSYIICLEGVFPSQP
jgi:microcystin-dependent protein